MYYASINLIGKQDQNVIALFPHSKNDADVSLIGNLPEGFIINQPGNNPEYLYFYDEDSIKGLPELELSYPGYTLVGWYDALNSKMVDLENDVIEGNVYLKALWSKDSVYEEHFANITFEDVDNSDALKQRFLKGYSISEPTAPTKDDYTFLGWSSSDSKDDLWNFDTPVYEDIRLHAQWRKSFNELNFVYGDEKVSLNIPYNTLVTEEQIPSVNKEGYRFKEWNTQADGFGEAFDLTQAITGDHTVYAIYDKTTESLQVQIKFIDGETIITKTVDINTVLNMNMLPTNENEDFLGWNTQADGTGTYITEDSLIKGNLKLYAIYESEEIETSPIPTPELSPKPDIPGESPEPITPDETPDLTPTPEQPEEIVEYEIEFIDGNHITYESVEANTHLEATEIPEPSNEDLLFKGWNFSSDGSGEFFSSDTIIHEDIILYAIYDTNNIVLPSTGIRSMMLPLSSLITLMGCMTLIVSIKPKNDSNL